MTEESGRDRPTPSTSSPDMAWTFHTTQWTQLLRLRDADPAQADEGWRWLVEAYGPPVHAYLRCAGLDAEAARDASQRFFSDLFRRGSLRSVEPADTRFRTWLMRCLKRRRIDEWRRVEARPEAPWPRDAGGNGLWDPQDLAEPPDLAFDRKWAQGVLDRAVVQVRGLYDSSPRRRELFEQLLGVLHEDPDSGSLREVAERLRLSHGTVRNEQGVLRDRYRQALRAEVAATVTEEAEIEEEWLFLRRLLAR
jgi:RNA polymerase sigma-70 factor (ECF subfamily)